MARQRTLHPDFFTDEKVVACSFPARLMFEGLWCVADREGRLEDKPLSLKMRLFPADAVDGAALIAELVAVGLVVRYQTEGRSYLAIPNFQKRQHVHPKEVPSKLPPPPKGTDDDEDRAEPSSMDEKPGLLPQERASNRAGPSGSSFPSGPSGPPPGPEKARARRAVAVGQEFLEWAYKARFELHGIPADDSPPNADRWAEFWSEFSQRDKRAQSRIFGMYLHDDHFRDRGWPIAVFIEPGVYRHRLRIVDAREARAS
jgi:hypothetical protein